MNDFDGFYVFCLSLPFLIIGLLILLYKFRKRFPLKWVYVVAWNIILLSALLSIVFAVGETHYRFFVDTTDSFALNKLSQRWNKRYYQLNNRNLRDNIDYYPQIANGKRRVTILGDSFTAGHGIKDVNDRFGNILRQKYSEVEVHQLAQLGANTFTELEMLRGAVSGGYQLDVIILVYCLNDIDRFVGSAMEIYGRIRAFNDGLSFLERESYFLNFLSFRWFALNDPDMMNYSDFVLEGYSGDSWEEQKKLFRELIGASRQMGKPLIVVTFPFLQQESENYSFREVHQLLGDFWQSERVAHLDLLNTYEPYLGNGLTVNKYDAHPNEFAHELAAEAIADFLRRSE